jgi:hypothetical protein
LSVTDATNIEAHARRSLLTLARDHNFTLVAIVFDVDGEAALRQNSLRGSRQVAAAVIRQQCESPNSSRKALSRAWPRRIRVTGTRFLTDVGYRAGTVLNIAAHELLYPPWPTGHPTRTPGHGTLRTGISN